MDQGTRLQDFSAGFADTLRQAMHDVGFEWLSFGLMEYIGEAGKQRGEQRVLYNTNSPVGWEERYLEQRHFEIDPRIAPAEGELVVRKKRVGAFSTTDLREQLDARGIDTLVLAGVATSGVVLSTVRDAADRDYRLVVLEDGCWDSDPEVHRVLTGKVFPRGGATVTTVEEFIASLG